MVPMLLLVAFGLLVGRRGFDAIAKLRRDYGPGLILALGFNSGRGPSADALSELLRRLDPAALEAALASWVRARLPDGVTHVCLDGKTLRGSRDGDAPGVHLLAAYAPEAQAVIGQMRVDAKTNEHKAALELLGLLPADGNVFTGDAMFCQKEVAEKIRDSGGDYVLIVKDNQRELRADIQAALQDDAGFSPLPAAAESRRRADGAERGQGARAGGGA
jgi:predicted transposase YbfD/YdcC